MLININENTLLGINFLLVLLNFRRAFPARKRPQSDEPQASGLLFKSTFDPRQKSDASNSGKEQRPQTDLAHEASKSRGRRDSRVLSALELHAVAGLADAGEQERTINENLFDSIAFQEEYF